MSRGDVFISTFRVRACHVCLVSLRHRFPSSSATAHVLSRTKSEHHLTLISAILSRLPLTQLGFIGYFTNLQSLSINFELTFMSAIDISSTAALTTNTTLARNCSFVAVGKDAP
jgi:hypothetical protein